MQRKEKDWFLIMNNKIYIIGMGPGDESLMTYQAAEVLDKCDVIVG